MPKPFDIEDPFADVDMESPYSVFEDDGYDYDGYDFVVSQFEGPSDDNYGGVYNDWEGYDYE